MIERVTFMELAMKAAAALSGSSSPIPILHLIYHLHACRHGEAHS